MHKLAGLKVYDGEWGPNQRLWFVRDLGAI